jgi:hypothetical protein
MRPRRLVSVVVTGLFGAAAAALVAGIGMLAAPRCRLWRRWGQPPDEL